MSEEVRNLEPKVLWNHFEDLNAVPRPSKKEERVIEFIMNFGKNLGSAYRKRRNWERFNQKAGYSGS